MSLPQSDCNLVGNHVYPIADLGLAVTVTSAAAVGSTVITTGYAATIVVLSTLASGSGTLKLKTAATAAGVTYGSPDVSLSVSGTSLQAATTATTASTLFFGLQQSAGTTATWDELAVLVLYELTAGEDWFSVRSNAINAVGNTTVGDGGGTLDLDIA